MLLEERRHPFSYSAVTPKNQPVGQSASFFAAVAWLLWGYSITLCLDMRSTPWAGTHGWNCKHGEVIGPNVELTTDVKLCTLPSILADQTFSQGLLQLWWTFSGSSFCIFRCPVHRVNCLCAPLVCCGCFHLWIFPGIGLYNVSQY